MNRLNARSGTILAFLAIGLTLGFAVTGMGFGLWIQQFSLQETLESGNVDLVFTSAFTDDDGTVDDVLLDSQDNASSTQVFDAWGPSSSADPAATGPDAKPHYDKDVARCQALIDGSVVQDGAYPSYNCTSWFSMQNSGTIPLKVKRILLSTLSGTQNLAPGGFPTLADLDDADLDGTNKTGADAEIGVSDLNICQQIDPGETVRIAVSGHGLQAAPQGAGLSYSVDVETAQWNELATSTDSFTQLYADVLGLLGDSGVVIPLGDFPPAEKNECPTIGQAGAGGDGFSVSSFTTVGAEALTFTWTEPPIAFDTAPTSIGFVPIVQLNGTDEKADSPNDAYWTLGDGVSDSPFTVGMWVNPDDLSTDRTLIGKAGEWNMRLESGKFRVRLLDGPAAPRKELNYTSTGVWDFFLLTYDGSGGPSAMNGVHAYINGSSSGEVGVNVAGYVAMSSQATDLDVANWAGSRFLDGGVGAGPLGPFFVRRELTPAEVTQIYTLGAQALGLIP